MEQVESYKQIVQMLKMKEQSIISISYSLLSHFDSERKMHFTEGEIHDYLVLKEIKTELLCLRKSELLFTSTSIGELVVTLFNKKNFIIRPVFYQHLNRYKDLLYIKNDLFIMTDMMSGLLEKIRK